VIEEVAEVAFQPRLDKAETARAVDQGTLTEFLPVRTESGLLTTF
jgi:hypothetical protein